jgi:hypothetical protein
MLITKVEAALAAVGHLTPARGGSFHPLTLGEIAAIENRLGRELPEDYRTFVLKYGSSTFARMVGFPLSGKRAVFIQVFYGGGEDHESEFHINWAVDMYASRMPPTLIPIADCGELGLICLGVRSVEYGKIFYWDRDREWGATQEQLQLEGKAIPPNLQYQNLTSLADTFLAFLSDLRIMDD